MAGLYNVTRVVDDLPKKDGIANLDNGARLMLWLYLYVMTIDRNLVRSFLKNTPFSTVKSTVVRYRF